MKVDGTFDGEERRKHRVALQVGELRPHPLASLPRNARFATVWKVWRTRPAHDLRQAEHEPTCLIDRADECHLVEIGEDLRNHVDEILRAADRPLGDPEVQRGCLKNRIARACQYEFTKSQRPRCAVIGDTPVEAHIKIVRDDLIARLAQEGDDVGPAAQERRGTRPGCPWMSTRVSPRSTRSAIKAADKLPRSEKANSGAPFSPIALIKLVPAVFGT